MNTLSYSLKTLPLILPLLFLAYINTASASEDNNPKVKLNIERAKQETLVNMQYLLGNVLEKSKVLQEAHGDFSPYGAALFLDGSVKYVWYAKPGQTVKNPAKSLPIIRQALQTQAQSEKIVGSAIIYKLNKDGQKRPRLTIELEYQTGLAVAFVTEIFIDADNKIVWGDNAQTNFEPRVFILKDQDNEDSKEKASEQPESNKTSKG